MTPALLSQENYTKKFSKSQKAGFDLIFCVARDTEITARFGFGGRYEPPAVMLCEKSFCLVFWFAVKNAFQSIEQFWIVCVPFFAVIIHKADAVQDIHKD